MTEGRGPARLERARQLNAAGHHVEAELIAQEVLTTEPDSVPALVLLARCLVAQDRAHDALTPAREACRLDPENVGALLSLSQAATRSARRELAVETAHCAVALSPHDSATHYTLAQALLAGTKDVYPALRAADEAVRLSPNWSDAHNLRGLCLSSAGRPDDARAAYARALTIEPGHALALSNLAALDIRNNPLSAAKMLTMAAGMDPQQAIIQHNLAVAAHNFVLHLQWAVVAGGLVEGVVVGSGGSHTARTIVVASLGVLVLVAAGYFVAQLPRGYRRSPLMLVRSLSHAVWVRLIILGFIAGFVCLVAFGDKAAAEANTGRLMLFALVGGVATLIRRAKAKH